VGEEVGEGERGAGPEEGVGVDDHHDEADVICEAYPSARAITARREGVCWARRTGVELGVRGGHRRQRRRSALGDRRAGAGWALDRAPIQGAAPRAAAGGRELGRRRRRRRRVIAVAAVRWWGASTWEQAGNLSGDIRPNYDGAFASKASKAEEGNGPNL
jgi:hypothetical protein